MADQLLLDNGSSPRLRLTSLNGDLTVYRDRIRGFGEISLFLLLLLAATIVSLMGLIAEVGLIWIAVTEFNILALLMVFPFGIALVLSLYAWIFVQGSGLSFKVTLGDGQYRFKNGLVRYSSRVKPQNTEAVIYPTYRQGDWGYGAKIKVTGRAWALPLVPTCILGTKHKALQEALRLCDWLQKNSAISQVTMSGWGNIDQVRPRPM